MLLIIWDLLQVLRANGFMDLSGVSFAILVQHMPSLENLNFKGINRVSLWFKVFLAIFLQKLEFNAIEWMFDWFDYICCILCVPCTNCCAKLAYTRGAPAEYFPPNPCLKQQSTRPKTKPTKKRKSNLHKNKLKIESKFYSPFLSGSSQWMKLVEMVNEFTRLNYLIWKMCSLDSITE